MAKLNTERLALRPFRQADAREFARLAGDWAVACMTSDIPYPLTAEQAGLWLRTVRGEVRFALEHEGELVGGAGYYRRPSGSAELGFWLGKDWWGRGFATEATRAVVRYGFQDQRVPMFTSAHFLDNPASRNVLRKLGFEYSAACTIGCLARGQDVEAATYRLDRSHAALHIQGLDQPPAPLERLRNFVSRMRRGLDRKKPAPGQPSSGLS